MPLRRRLVLLMAHRQLIQLCLVVLDVAPRAARSAPSRCSLKCKETPSDAVAAEGRALAPPARVTQPVEMRVDPWLSGLSELSGAVRPQALSSAVRATVI
eukprot:4612053-Prymnesium_polylepis.1